MTTPQSETERACRTAQQAARAIEVTADIDIVLNARDDAHAVACAWRDGATAGGDIGDTCARNATAWDNIANAWHQCAHRLTQASDMATSLTRRTEARTVTDRNELERNAPPHIAWRGNHAYIDNRHVAVMTATDDGMKIGIWNPPTGDFPNTGEIEWTDLSHSTNATDHLRDIANRNDLHTIPADANLFPPLP